MTLLASLAWPIVALILGVGCLVHLKRSRFDRFVRVGTELEKLKFRADAIESKIERINDSVGELHALEIPHELQRLHTIIEGR